MNSSLPQRSNVTAVQRAPAEPLRAYKLTPKPQVSLQGTEHREAAKPAFKIVRMGQNEVDYVAKDVTIRRFRSTPALQMRVAEKRIDFGEDVTVRYFESKTPVAEKNAAGIIGCSIDRTLACAMSVTKAAVSCERMNPRNAEHTFQQGLVRN